MCDFNKIVNFIIGAQIAFLVSIVTLTSAAGLVHIPYPYGLIAAAIAEGTALTGVITAIVLITIAIGELNNCKGGECGKTFQKLIEDITAFRNWLIPYSVEIVGLSILLFFPGSTSAAITTIILWVGTATVLIESVVLYSITNSIKSYNECLSENTETNNNSSTQTIITLGWVTIVVILVIVGVAYISGAIPFSVAFG